MNLYTVLLIMLAVALFVVTAGMAVGAIMGSSRLDKVKNANYKCGCDPTPNRGNQARFPVKYHLIAMMFVTFDIEVVFLHSWAVSFTEQGKLGMLMMMLFVELLAVPFIYAWARRGLDWS